MADEIPKTVEEADVIIYKIKFSPGTVVYLKSDTNKELPLTVESLDEKCKVTCIFLNPITKEIKREIILPEALK